MDPFTEIALYLIKTASMLYTSLIVMRFLLQLARADFYNPICQFIVKATNAPLRPLRRTIPSIFGLDTASLILALAVQLLAITLLMLLFGVPLLPEKIITWALLNTVAVAKNLVWMLLLISIVLSWVAPGSYHPGAQLINQVCEPMLAPIRKILPTASGIDFSPILAFSLIHILGILLRHAAASTGLYNTVLSLV